MERSWAGFTGEWNSGRARWERAASSATRAIEQMQSTMNLRIKFRESFRPFAPCVLAEDVEKYFELDRESPYMLLVADVAEGTAPRTEPEQVRLMKDPDLRKRVNVPRVDLAGDHACGYERAHANGG